MLLRAFGPIDAEVPAAINGELALRLSEIFGTAARIAARHLRRQLIDEVGSESRKLAILYLGARFKAGRVLSAAERVAEIASELEIPLVFLKFVALHHTVDLAEGCRPVADCDVLAEEGRVLELHKRLIEEGWQGIDHTGTEQHLPQLVHPTYGAVEIHRVVLGVRIGESRQSATLQALQNADLLTRLEQLSGQSSILNLAPLVAHVIVHGLVQHGWPPSPYPQLKMIGDLIDLGVGAAYVEDLLADVRPLVSAAVANEDLLSLRELCLALAQREEDIGSAAFLKSPKGVLLRHILARRLVPDYEQALATRSFTPALSDAGRAIVWRRTLLAKTFLSRGEAAAKYGIAKTVPGYVWTMVVLRPIDVVRRWASYSASWVRQRVGHQRG